MKFRHFFTSSLLPLILFGSLPALDGSEGIVNEKKSSTESSIWKEIKDFKDLPEIKQQLKIKDPYFREVAGLIETINVANSKESAIDRALHHFFLNIFPGGMIRSSSKDGLVLLTPEKAPQLFEVINSLCEKMALPVPVVLLSGDKKMFNAAATSLSENLSMVILGQGLLKKLSNEELRSVLAHEFGHIKHSHVPRQLGVAVLGSIVLPLFLSYFIHRMDNGERIIQVRQPNHLIKFLQSGSGSMFLFSVCSTLTAILLLNRSRIFEKEADMTALETTDDTQAFISMMEKIEQYTLDKKEKFESSYELVCKKLEELEKESPLIAKFLKWRTDAYHELEAKSFDNVLVSEDGDHPSCKQRKEYAQEFEKNRQNSEQIQS